MPLMPGAQVEFGGAQGLTTLFSQTLAAPAASLDATGLSFAGYTMGIMVGKLRSVRAGQTEDSVRCRLNNDSGANYYSQYGQQSNTGWTLAGQTGQDSFRDFGDMPAATADANYFAQFRWEFMFPADTDFDKTFTGHGVAPLTSAADQLRQWISSGRWDSTAAITRITIFSGNGENLAIGSRITVLAY